MTVNFEASNNFVTADVEQAAHIDDSIKRKRFLVSLNKVITTMVIRPLDDPT